MPNLTQSLNILRNGIPKSRSRKAENEAPTGSKLQQLPIRDHYLRYEHFQIKQYPKRAVRQFCDVAVLRKAELAARDTTLGIIDSLTREYLVYHFPESEAFLDAEASDDSEEDIAYYKRLATGLVGDILQVASRIDCGIDSDAGILRDVLLTHALRQLERLNSTCGDILKLEDTIHFSLPQSPLAIRSKNNSPESVKADTMTDARILNSSLAWDLNDMPVSTVERVTETKATISVATKKRGFSEAHLYEDFEAADNGEAWSAPGIQVKRQKFEVKFRQVTDVVVANDQEAHNLRSTKHSNTGARIKQFKENVVDLTGENDRAKMDESDKLYAEHRSAHKQQPDHDLESEFRIPGSFA